MTLSLLAYVNSNRAALALEDARKCVTLAPTWPKSYFRLGKALLALNRLLVSRFYDVFLRLLFIQFEIGSQGGYDQSKGDAVFK